MHYEHQQTAQQQGMHSFSNSLCRNRDYLYYHSGAIAHAVATFLLFEQLMNLYME